MNRIVLKIIDIYNAKRLIINIIFYLLRLIV